MVLKYFIVHRNMNSVIYFVIANGKLKVFDEGVKHDLSNLNPYLILVNYI